MAAPAADLLEDPVDKTLIRLAGPMFVGIGAMMLFGVVDAYWVAQLGNIELAAMSYTFPVTAAVMNVGVALGVGSTSAAARAIGAGDRRRVAQLATHGLWLATLMAVAASALAYATLDWTFAALGATPATLALIDAYMGPWLAGAPCVVVAMVGNGAIRGTGDTRTQAATMLVAGLINACLTPVLVFGLGPASPMGLAGAAYSTVISWGVSLALVLGILRFRDRLLVLSVDLGAVRRSWHDILHVGLPALATNMLFPLSAGVITRMVAQYGDDAVAAFGVASRVEQVAMIGVFALSTAITPIVGQNYGAHRYARVRDVVRFALRASLLWGLGTALLLVAVGRPLSALFSDGPAVADLIYSYWLVVPVCYGLLGVSVLANAIHNALDQPLRSARLIGIRLFGLLLPLVVVGARLGDLTGLFVGISLAFAGGGLAAHWMVHRLIDRMEADRALVVGRHVARLDVLLHRLQAAPQVVRVPFANVAQDGNEQPVPGVHRDA